MTHCEARKRRHRIAAYWLPLALVLTGCNRGPELGRVEGLVTYNGEPLNFGSVMFQGPQGPPATARIGEGGAFRLEVRGAGSGAMVGLNRVRVCCYETQSPDFKPTGDAEMSLGRSLIPLRYTNPRTSPLKITVEPGDNDVRLDLTD